MADILISGIEMPKSGYVEMLLKVSDGEIYYNYAGSKEVKSADFVPLPEGHGRLIDADKLDYTMLYKENWMRGTGVEAPAIWKSDIDAADTIVPAVRSRKRLAE